MKKKVLDFFKGFFDMVVGGRTDYEQTQALLCVNEKCIQLCGNISTPVNTGAEEYCHRDWMLTLYIYCEYELEQYNGCDETDVEFPHHVLLKCFCLFGCLNGIVGAFGILLSC